MLSQVLIRDMIANIIEIAYSRIASLCMSRHGSNIVHRQISIFPILTGKSPLSLSLRRLSCLKKGCHIWDGISDFRHFLGLFLHG